MKKPVEKRIVQIEATRQWIEGYGYKRKSDKISNRYTYGWIISFVISYCLAKWWNVTAGFVVLGLVAISVIVFGLQCRNAGKKFWNDNKDKEQPIKL